ncbi:ATP-dependent Clp protease adaptor ClpS [Candidatus Haliotispira prima]|uniref:ATP-dependent Clp protease adapter protein ClpS n=1 Tax=Candidatus Haliotispira prima TaxID=3034016 RepID=A0ABY8MJ46_9SPIO|nr:ATP-dependent Clp protease adaptor ClpS [Candidatus Haliotispira prima]
MPATKEEEDSGVGVDTALRQPKSYQVIMLNDDYTTRDFVVEVLVEVFRKSRPEATALMLNIHNEGRTVVGVYSYDIAVSKVRKTAELARKADFPLRCQIEEV